MRRQREKAERKRWRRQRAEGAGIAKLEIVIVLHWHSVQRVFHFPQAAETINCPKQAEAEA